MDDEKRARLFMKGLKELKPNWVDHKLRLANYIFAGSSECFNQWDYNTKNVWDIDLEFPSREELNNLKQMRDIRGTAGRFPDSNGGHLLRLECVCKTQILHPHIIADATRAGERGFHRSKLVVGSCCVKKLVDVKAFHKHCLDCNSLEVRRKQVRCELCRPAYCNKCGVGVGLMGNGRYYKHCYKCNLL